MARKVRLGVGGAVALMLVVVLGVQLSRKGPAPAAAAGVDAYMARPEIVLRGTLRDFTPRKQPGGHPDFARPATAGWGRYAEVVENFLDEEGKPQFASTGRKVTSPWLNGTGVPVGPFLPYVTMLAGDVEGSVDGTEGGTITTEANFASWFRDDSSLNRSQRVSIPLTRQPDNTYVFDGRLDDPALGGAEDLDFSHTWEADTTFVYKPGRDWYLQVGTDADVWVFIDGRLVIDGGAGVQAPYMYPGIALDGKLSLANTASIDIADGTVATVSTNATGADVITISNSAVIDGHLLVGPGGDPAAGIKSDRPTAVGGETGALDDRVEIAPIVVPGDLGAATGDLVLSGLTTTIDRDMHLSNVRLDSGARLTIRGNVRMLVDNDFRVLNTSQVLLEPNSRLVLYVGRVFEMRQKGKLNANTQDSGLVTVNVFGTQTLNIDNQVEVYADVRAPQAKMSIGNSSVVCGSFHGKELDISNSGRFVVVDPEWDSGGASHRDITMTQRIELDRLVWLTEDGTHRVKILFAERSRPRSKLRLETNILTLNLAGTPRGSEWD